MKFRKHDPSKKSEHGIRQQQKQYKCMKNKISLACIIVSYNSYNDIVQLLDSIANQNNQPEYIIIVDNLSPN